MSELSAQYAQATKLILSIQDGLTKLESTTVPHYGEASGLAKDLHARLMQLQRLSGELDSNWRMHMVREASSVKRDVWKRKVEKVADDVDKLSRALDKNNIRDRRRQREEEERQELIARRMGHGGGGADSLRLQMDEESQVESITSSRRVVAEAYETGLAVLGKMAGQRDALKSIHRKALDVANRLGLSDSLLRVIDKRQRVDKVITYGGMIVTILVLLLVWWTWG